MKIARLHIHTAAGAAALVCILGPAAGAARADDAPNIARVLAPTAARSAPGDGRFVTSVQPQAPRSGGPTQLRIIKRRTIDGRLYLRVLLPMRPNGSSAWISASKVQLLHTDYRVRINRGARRITITRDGRTVRTARVVVGAPASPTPAGDFAISEEIRRSAGEFVGAWVLPLTAFSGTYKQFDGGPGRVAIHGRGGASLLDPVGTARSHGCIRVTNKLVRWMARNLQPGVPVTIR
jgi:lipoprotein-anchoring transpeptidase ErfK/SrfK